MKREKYIARQVAEPWEIVEIAPDGTQRVVGKAKDQQTAEADARVRDARAEHDAAKADRFTSTTNRRDRD